MSYQFLNDPMSKNQFNNCMDSFKQLLQEIKSLDEKKQHLWLEIYQNALTDRQNAYQNYIELMKICGEKSSEHAVHGRTMAIFLERMSKSNDQLIKLADLVAKAQEKDDESTLSKDDVYTMINSQAKN